MAYNSFLTNILIRMFLLLGSFTGLAYLLVNNNRFFTLVFLAGISILQIISLIYFLNKTNRDLARFLLLLTEEDTSVVAWKDRVEKTFQGLHHSFRQVNEEINRIRLDNERGSILLQNVIDHLQTGIFAVDERGNLELVNDEALKILGVPELVSLEDLESTQAGLAEKLSKLRYNSGNILKVNAGGEDQMPVLVNVSAFRLLEKKIRLYSIKGIKNELEANEIESWQKLTRVLAHEISNSVTPISTLGAGIQRKLSQASKDDNDQMVLPEELAKDLIQSSVLIEKRCDALVEFMEHYKSFTRLPDPAPAKIEASDFFESLRLFFNDDLNRTGVKMEYRAGDEDLCIFADRSLLEQAFINLIRNALEAMEGQEYGQITMEAGLRNGLIQLVISDNGHGIAEDIKSQVFIPFFTTKQTGTGIGMSIVRKIVIMSGGSIYFRSVPGVETAFYIELPAC